MMIILMIEQISFADANNLYLYEESKNPADKANRYIEEAYITPMMQADVLDFYEKPFIIDAITRMPVLYELNGIAIEDKETKKQQVMPTIEELIEYTTPSLLSRELKKRTLNALHASLEAIDIAKFVVTLEASYFYKDVDPKLYEILNEKTDKVHQLIDVIESMPAKSENRPFTYNYKDIHPTSIHHFIFSQEQVAAIVKNNDFKKLIEDRSNRTKLMKAANLLVKQCFIAQQLHLKDHIRFGKLAQEIKDIYYGNYIYELFPGVETLIKTAKNMPTEKDQNKMFKHIRQAVQTALYIAHKNSNYYLTTDPFIAIFKEWDAKLAEFCTNPEYGADQRDIDYENRRSNLTLFAAGTAVIGVAGAYYGYNNPDVVKSITDQASGLVKQAYDTTDKSVNTIKTSLPPKEPYTFGKGVKAYTKAQELEYGIPEESQSWAEWLKATVTPEEKGLWEKQAAKFNEFIGTTKK
ncbi:hypothetical protein KBC04_03970 [Candidatus Babeliales bacterium]|nr:hypothetical protein [Candidatus Babeliales bacterium]MBP9843347.1 hypothetical protein [Candidatus Babeliales bacterium]